MQGKNDENANLYNVLERGDRKMKGIKPFSIVMVGLTRAGKSTSFNWILNKDMVGAGDQISTYYRTVVNGDNQVAELGDSFTSVTLVPNLALLDNLTTLIDMAGYQDKRNYVGVLGVSYFLKAVFQNIHQVKFIIVIGETSLFDPAGDGIIQTLKGFTNMFKIQSMDAETREKFYASISLIVTKAEKKTKHRGAIERIARMLNQDKLNIPKKDLYIQILTSIIKSNRIIEFEAAELNAPPQISKAISNFNLLKWTYFDYRTINEIGTGIISLPFENDFKQLDEEQQKLFSSAIEKRVLSYEGFAGILKTLVNTVQYEWRNPLKYDSFFAEVEKFIEQNDSYNSDKLIDDENRNDYKPLSLIQTIRNLLELNRIIDRIGDQSQDFLKNMETYTLLFSQMVQYLRKFAHNREEDRLLLRLQFVLKRGFREFSMLFEIKPEIIINASQKVKDNLQDVFSLTRQELIENFVTDMKYQELQRLFPTHDLLSEYSAFYEEYLSQFEYSIDPAASFSQRTDIGLITALNKRQNGENKEALAFYISTLKHIMDLEENVSGSDKSTEEVELELDALSMRKLQLVDFIREILLVLPHPNAKQYALSLCTHVNSIEESCQIFQLIIPTLPEKSLKMTVLEDYANYCIKWGRFEQANILLQRLLGLELTDYANRKRIVQRLFKLAEDIQRHSKDYKELLCSWTRLPVKDETFETVLTEIKQIILDIWE